jgi:type IV pilus assembly protein PilQ
MKTLQENKAMGRSWMLGVAVALLSAPAAWAQTQIRAINTSQQAGVEVVRIELSEPLPAVPTGFTIQAPPRIAIDLPGVVNGIGRNLVEINQGNLRSANVAQAGDRSRVVLNLRQASSFSAKLEGNSLVRKA